MSNILLALVDVNAAVGLARQHAAIEVIVMLVAIIIDSPDHHNASSL